jgi:glycosyltransferase involved in cell wall biosynthesis
MGILALMSNNHPQETDLVSIIMPSYNSANYIEESIRSVMAQSYPHWELLIADDCSTDETQTVVTKMMEKDSRIKFLPASKNFGPAVTRNRAIDAAQGRFIAFLDSDDLWNSEKLTKQITFMKQHNIALSYGWYNVIDEDGKHLKTINQLPTKTTYNQLLRNQIIGCLTSVYDTHICGKQKMPVIRKRQDFALWLKILKQGHTAYCLEDVLGSYRIRANSVSRNKWVAIKFTWNLYRKIERLPFLKSCRIFCLYIVHSLLRK